MVKRLVRALLGRGTATTGARALTPGMKAPESSLVGTDGRSYRLSCFVGTRGFVLAWFPKAFTPGWTKELTSLRDSADALAAFDVAVFMVSLDTPERNRQFAGSLAASHVLLSDPTGDAARAYGVRGFGGLYARRVTFYVDADGVIRFVDRDVKVATAGPDIARRLAALGFPRR